MKERNIAVSIILTIITCGIYGIYWFITLTDDAKSASGDENFTSGGVAFLLTLVTCGLYGYYWAWKMGEVLAAAKNKNGLSGESQSVIYLVLQICGLGIVNYGIMQNELNEIARSKVGGQA